MPSKTARGGASKTHNRGSSASSTTKLNLNLTTAALARNKSAEKIGKRNSADVTANFRAAPSRPPPPPLQVDVASGGGGNDDDEWVSSESGAVTPADYDEDDSPPSPDDDNDNDTDVEPIPSTTPRGEHPQRPPLQPQPLPPPSRPRPQSLVSLQRVDTAAAERGHSRSNSNLKAHSQQQRSPDSLRDAPLNSAAPARRPPSVRGPARPHPLIRARSYAPAPSTPIVAPATVSSSHATSPASEHAPTTHTLHRQNSRSSITSVATLPLPSTVAGTAVTRVHSERHRARSSVTSAALSSLAAAAHAHAPSRPPSPQFAVAFPPAHPRDEQVHVMIPPPLVPTHVSATAHQNPFLEALQRVTEAKARAGR